MRITFTQHRAPRGVVGYGEQFLYVAPVTRKARISLFSLLFGRTRLGQALSVTLFFALSMVVMVGISDGWL